MISETIYSVSDFVYEIQGVIRSTPLFRMSSIVGEISNFTAHRSGHFYFSLKDDKAVLSIVMFRSYASKVKFKLKNGDRVIVKGELEVYPASGQIQLYAQEISIDGLGELYIRFEQLRKELFDLGWFDEKHKKKIPNFPKRVGVLCGSDSAAYADISRTLSQRWPIAKQVDYFALVQGEQAACDIVKTIHQAELDQVDVLIVARGGGSIEDLWPFNRYEVVEAIYQSKIPIITGIGHESDITLSDYVADLRCATPTAAAVSAVPNKDEINSSLREFKNNIYLKMVNRLRNTRSKLDLSLKSHWYQNPLSILDHYHYRLDYLNSRLFKHTDIFSNLSISLTNTVDQLSLLLYQKLEQNRKTAQSFNDKAPLHLHYILSTKRKLLKNKDIELTELLNSNLKSKRNEFVDLLKSLNQLSPLNIMQRGFSVVKMDDRVIKRQKDLSIGDDLSIRFTDGEIKAKVIERSDYHE